MKTAVTALSRGFAIISALSIVVLMLAIAADVVMRTVTQASLPGMIELAESCLVIAIFFGLALAGTRGEHVSVTLLADRLNPAWNRVFDIAVWLCSSVFLAWMLWSSTQRAIDSTEQGEERFGLIRWPMWPLRWVIVIGFAAILIVALLNAVRSITGAGPLGAAGELELAAQQEADLEAEVGALAELHAEPAGRGEEVSPSDETHPVDHSGPGDPPRDGHQSGRTHESGSTAASARNGDSNGANA
ncbi:MAG: TRAP transporter small permease [Pseudoclavibacter sp.]